VGVFLIYIFTETPLEEWAENCAWGDDSSFKGVDVNGITSNELKKQIRELFEILCEFEVKCGYNEQLTPVIARYRVYDTTSKGIVLRIRNGLFDPHTSEFVVKNLTIAIAKKWKMDVSELHLRAAEYYRKHKSAKVKYIDYSWTWKELAEKWNFPGQYYFDKAGYKKGEFSCSVQLNFNGEMYPSKPKECKGDIAIVNVYGEREI